MTLIQVNEKDLFKAIDQAFKDLSQILPEKYTKDNIFEKYYGPGIAGHWPKNAKGTYYVLASSPCKDYSRFIVVCYVTATVDHSPKEQYLNKSKLAHKVTSYLTKKGTTVFYDRASLGPDGYRRWKISAGWN